MILVEEQVIPFPLALEQQFEGRVDVFPIFFQIKSAVAQSWAIVCALTTEEEEASKVKTRADVKKKAHVTLL